MGSTVHFFIPLGRALPVPDGFNKTKYPSGQQKTEEGVIAPTTDSAHFIFHQRVLQGSPHLSMEAGFEIAAKRTHTQPRQESPPGILRTAHQTVVEAMVELDYAPLVAAQDLNNDAPDEITRAFDYAVSELNILLRAIAMALDEPLRIVARESLPPMIPIATSDTKPWEMIDKTDLPDVESFSIFNVNWNIPIAPDSTQEHAQLDTWIDAALVNLSTTGPFITYRDFRREADLTFFAEGNYRTAIILYASACESLLDELLQHNLWEQNLRPEEAASKFLNQRGSPRGIVDLVKNELGKFYSGWGRNTPEVIIRWITYVTDLRNQAIHDGYLPTSSELRTCVETVNALVEFLADQAFETRTRRPITALAFLGRAGLESRGGWDEQFSSYEAGLTDVNFRLRVFRRWGSALSYFRAGDRKRPVPSTEQSTCYMVTYPQGKTEVFLVDQNGVMAQPITREEVILPATAEESIRRFEYLNAPIPTVTNLPYEKLTLREEPRWEHYVYDVLPGHEVVFSTLWEFEN